MKAHFFQRESVVMFYGRNPSESSSDIAKGRDLVGHTKVFIVFPSYIRMCFIEQDEKVKSSALGLFARQ